MRLNFLFVLLTSIPFLAVNASHDDGSDISVHVTHDSSCICNHITSNCACTLYWDGSSIVTHHNVEHIANCDRHYCVSSDNKVTCSGPVFETLGGNHRYNPLSYRPDEPSGSDEDVTEVSEMFHGGYNLKIPYYEKNAITTYARRVEKIDCDGKFGTCVFLEGNGEDADDDNRPVCFGIPGDEPFHGDIESFLLGGSIQFLLTIPLLLVVRVLCLHRPNLHYFLVFFVVLPLAAICSIAIVEFAHHFFLVMYAYILGCLIGGLLSDAAARFLVGIWVHHFGKKVSVDEQAEMVGLTRPEDNFDDDDIPGDHSRFEDAREDDDAQSVDVTDIRL